MRNKGFVSTRQRKAVMAKLSKLRKEYDGLVPTTIKKLPRTIVPSDYQIGTTHIKQDRQHRALKPGKRVSKRGNVYYEHRRDHSDKHPAQHL